MKKATERFSEKVEDYVNYRPRYPHEVIEYLRTSATLKPGSTIVDIGSGTGIFTKQLLDEGYEVYAVEPNAEMREASESLLGSYPAFIPIAASGEQTTLQSHIADMVVCATAFHWLDASRARTEFARILKSDENGLRSSKRVALIWNIRRDDADEFSVAYEEFWRAYDRSGKQDVSEDQLSAFFRGPFEIKSFQHAQSFDLRGLVGRSFSSSFSPKPKTAAGIEFEMKLGELFNRYQKNNEVKVHYTCKVYLGDV